MEFIIDPADNKSYSIYSKNGLELLNEYLQLYKEGGRRKQSKRSKRLRSRRRFKKMKSFKGKPKSNNIRKKYYKLKNYIADPDNGKLAKYLEGLSK